MLEEPEIIDDQEEETTEEDSQEDQEKKQQLDSLDAMTFVKFSPLEPVPTLLADGVHQFNDESTGQVSSITFKDGQKNGPMYVFEKGVLSVEMMFLNNVLNGVMKYYFPNKALQLILNYAEGQLEGDFIQYHPNGIVQMQMYYKNGQKQGVCKIYDAFGNLVQDMIYVNDLLDGPIHSYHEDKLVARKYYKEGVEVISDQ